MSLFQLLPQISLGSQDFRPVRGKMRGEEKGKEEDGDERRKNKSQALGFALDRWRTDFILLPSAGPAGVGGGKGQLF